jgi:hypothetical protein
MAVTDRTSLPVQRASRSLVVALKGQGVVVPRTGDEPELVVDLAGLQVIEAIGSGRGLPEAMAGRSELEPLVRALEARGWLETDEGDRHGAPAAADGPIAAEHRGSPDRDPGIGEVLDGEFVLPLPMLLRCGPDGFEYVDHEGRVGAHLRAVEVLAAAVLGTPCSIDTALAQHRDQVPDGALDRPAYQALVERLIGAGLVVPFDPGHPVHARRSRQAEAMREGIRRQWLVHQEFDRLEAEHDDRDGATDRVRVVGFHPSWSGLPASLAMIIASAKAYEGGMLEEAFDFRPRLFWDRPRLDVAAEAGPSIFLFSNYIWSTSSNLAHSARVKELGPHHVTVHGGPDTPKYFSDAERFFAANPHVDVAVHGEGEATFAHMLDALRGSIGDGPPDLSVLAEVPGLSFRDGDRIIQTASRDRIADLDSIPSPVLTGLYDGFIPAGSSGAIIMETNRGCPYGCTFCDWGSATLSRVRKFDMERIFAELEWAAKHQLETVGIADANFGIFERDVEIAQKIAELKAHYGYPRFVGNNYAKNTVKHLSQIIEIFTEAGIVAEGKMSMQTFDEGTLATIRRKNIKVEKYHDLSGEFRRNNLPMMVDIMMGLPGSTPETFRSDLQECISRAVRVAIHTTILLTNSPMNEPEYREEHGITARPGEEVKQTSTYTAAEWQQMNRLTYAYYVFENFGVLRQVGTYVHAETGQREIDFYERLVEDAHAEPDRWPIIAMTLGVLPEMTVPPVSWTLFLDEIRRYLIEVVGLADDSALDTVLAVQHALLPARDRTFPLDIQLAHDYASWQAAVVELRDEGYYHDWHEHAPALRELAPAGFTVGDPFDVCTTAMGGSLRSLMVENSWDLDSPVSRPRQRLEADMPMTA